MLRKSLLGLAFALATFNVSAQEVIVRVAPPHARIEHRPPRPAREYVWTPGYYRWDGHRHNWVEGRWERPPRRHAHWVAHHWVKRHGGWVFIEGHWS